MSATILQLDKLEHGNLRDNFAVKTYGDMLVLISIRFIVSQALESMNAQLFKENLAVNSASSQFLELLIQRIEYKETTGIAHVVA